jgi:hypothetical protein
VNKVQEEDGRGGVVQKKSSAVEDMMRLIPVPSLLESIANRYRNRVQMMLAKFLVDVEIMLFLLSNVPHQ